MISNPLFVLAVLSLNIAVSEWLARNTPLRHLGSALLVIVLTAVMANIGVIPVFSADVPVYTGVFDHVAPLAIFLLLLQVNLRGLLRAGVPMVLLFLLGSLATMAGVLAGMWVVGGSRAFGELHHALAGMFVGTYTGGSINFNAIALEYGVVKNGPLFAGAAAVDSAMTTVWMVATVALPRVLSKLRPVTKLTPAAGEALRESVSETQHAEHDTETVQPFDLAVLLALGAASVWISGLANEWIRQVIGVNVPTVLILTTLALVLAQLEAVQRLKGTRLCGWLAVMVFLAVIGALCDVAALRGLEVLGRSLMIFVFVVVLVHGLIVFGLGTLLRVDPAMSAVASQANIGGSTSALALARSLGRGDLALPGILVGALGNAVGTYLGFLTAALLSS